MPNVQLAKFEVTFQTVSDGLIGYVGGSLGSPGKEVSGISLYTDALCLFLKFLLQVSICRNSIKEQERVQQTVLDEITLMHKLRHPHIVQCLGATQHTGHFNIFMEIMPGNYDIQM